MRTTLDRVNHESELPCGLLLRDRCAEEYEEARAADITVRSAGRGRDAEDRLEIAIQHLDDVLCLKTFG